MAKREEIFKISALGFQATPASPIETGKTG
jgi:hypothetical protein